MAKKMKNKIIIVDLLIVVYIIYIFIKGYPLSLFFIFFYALFVVATYLPARTLYYYNHKILALGLMIIALLYLYCSSVEYIYLFGIDISGFVALIFSALMVVNFCVGSLLMIVLPILFIIRKTKKSIQEINIEKDNNQKEIFEPSVVLGELEIKNEASEEKEIDIKK